MTKKAIRAAFRRSVFSRDRYRCAVCGRRGQDRQDAAAHEAFHQSPDVVLDAHHISDRHEFPHGGYVLENGISLCGDCHLKAEHYHATQGKVWVEGFDPETLYRTIHSSREQAFLADRESAPETG